MRAALPAWVLLAAVVLLTAGPLPAENADLPGPARVALAKAARLIQDKAYGEAAAALEAFQAGGEPFPGPGIEDPRGTHHPEVYFALGTCRLMQKAYAPAKAAYQKALQRDPGHLSSWLNLAQAAYGLGDYPLAARGFAEAYDHAPAPDPEYLYSSAAALLMAEDYGFALMAFEKLFARHPDTVQTAWRENYVHALLAENQVRRALPHIRNLAAANTGEKQVQWQEILLHQYLALDMAQAALDLILKLTREAPLRDKWWQALAHLALRENHYEQALMALLVVGYLRPLSAQETRLVADLNLQVGIPVKAATLYAAALEENRDPRLLKNLVQALQQLGRLEEALAACRRFAPHSRDGELLMIEADLLYALERFSEAGQAYRRAAAADRRRAGRAWLMAGYAALQLQDAAAGREALAKAATFEGQRQAALVAMRRLPDDKSSTAEESKGSATRSRPSPG
jgi:tetratricopeptide (TPR) repeat protein